jgi:hypothetical protein
MVGVCLSVMSEFVQLICLQGIGFFGQSETPG